MSMEELRLYEKAIALVDFWYDTDVFNFRNMFDSFKDAVDSAKDQIKNNLERTIEIIETDVDEYDDEEFTEKAAKIIDLLKGV